MNLTLSVSQLSGFGFLFLWIQLVPIPGLLFSYDYASFSVMLALTRIQNTKNTSMSPTSRGHRKLPKKVCTAPRNEN